MRQEPEKYKIHRDRKGGKIKAFLVGAVATITVGGSYAVDLVKEHTKELEEKTKNEWKSMNADADSISVDLDKAHFYAVKKVDQKALNAANAKLDTLMKQRQALVDKANRDFTKAFNNRDAEGMKKAIADHADNINSKNAQGLTPLMVLLKESESAKSYLCARSLISHVDVKVQDNDGASAVEYAALNKTIKGEVLKRDIEEKIANDKRAEEAKRKFEMDASGEHFSTGREAFTINNPTTYDELTVAINATRLEIEKINDSAYEIEVDKDSYSASVSGYEESGDQYSSFGSGDHYGGGHKKVVQTRRFLVENTK